MPRPTAALCVLALLAGCATPPPPPELPPDAGWLSVTLRASGPEAAEDGTTTVRTLFVSRGERWFFGLQGEGGRGFAAASDGERAATTIPDPEVDPASLDPRRELRQLYAHLQPERWVGNGRIDGERCHRWTVRWSGDGPVVDVWVAEATSLPKRIRTRIEDRVIADEQYFPPPEELEVGPRLFDTERLDALAAEVREALPEEEEQEGEGES